MDYFSFEDVMHELELGEEELKRMVSEGELRAFRDENKMKFKKEDVESLKKGRITEPTIILPSTPSSETTDETVLDLDIGQETAALSDTSAQLAAVGGKGRREEEDLIVPSEEVGSDQEETFIEEDTDTGLSTEPLKLADETAEETVAAEAVEEEAPPPPPTRKRTGMTGQQRKVTARIPVAVEQEIEKKRAHPVWTLFIFLALLASLYSGFFFVDMVRLESGQEVRGKGASVHGQRSPDQAPVVQQADVPPRHGVRGEPGGRRRHGGPGPGGSSRGNAQVALRQKPARRGVERRSAFFFLKR